MNSAPYADWRTLQLNAVQWFPQGSASSPNFAPLAWTADQLDAITENTTAAVNGFAGRKPTFTDALGDYGTGRIFGYGAQVALPNFTIAKQPGRLASWDGLVDGDQDTEFAGRRVALLIENVITSVGADQTLGVDLVAWWAGVKFRGFGAPVLADTPNTLTQDAGLASLSSAGAAIAASVYPDMSVPSQGTGTLNPAVPTFAPDGVARFQTLVEVPDTCGMGDIVEFTCLGQFAASRVTAIQWFSIKYMWLVLGRDGKWPFPSNSTVQCLGQDLDNGSVTLEPQSREDFQPYEP